MIRIRINLESITNDLKLQEVTKILETHTFSCSDENVVIKTFDRLKIILRHIWDEL